MEEEVYLKDFVKFFWSKKIYILLVAVLFAIIGWGYTVFLITPVYEVTTSLILTEMEFEDEADVAAYSKLIDRYSVVASSNSVVNKVKENLKLDIDIEKLKKKIVVHSMPISYSMKIVVQDSNSHDAVKIANETAKVFVEEVANIYKDNKIKILDYAEETVEPVNVHVIKNVLVFFVCGMFLICGYFFLIYIFEEKINVQGKDDK